MDALSHCRHPTRLQGAAGACQVPRHPRTTSLTPATSTRWAAAYLLGLRSGKDSSAAGCYRPYVTDQVTPTAAKHFPVPQHSRYLLPPSQDIPSSSLQDNSHHLHSVLPAFPSKNTSDIIQTSPYIPALLPQNTHQTPPAHIQKLLSASDPQTSCTSTQNAPRPRSTTKEKRSPKIQIHQVTHGGRVIRRQSLISDVKYPVLLSSALILRD